MFIKPGLAILISSVAFVAIHFTHGAAVVVGVDLSSVLVDSLLLGIIFKRSNNVYVCTVAHFLCNSFSMLMLLTLPHVVG